MRRIERSHPDGQQVSLPRPAQIFGKRGFIRFSVNSRGADARVALGARRMVKTKQQDTTARDRGSNGACI